MDLDVRQTRRMFLAGTAAFPKPFPSAGGISIEDGSLAYPTRTERVTFVVVQESTSLKLAELRVVRQDDVAAVFFPGFWKDGVFHFAEGYCVHDVDKGEWFLYPDIDAETISEKLKINIKCRDSGARGIVFVPASKPVLTIDEATQTADISDATWPGCFLRTSCFAPGEK